MTNLRHLRRSLGTTLAILASAMMAEACTGTANARAQAEEATGRFHQMFNNQEFAAIYRQADPAFKKTTSEPQLTDFLRPIRSSLGNFERVPDSGQWLVNWSTSGTYVTITENSVFSWGTATETFVWRVDGGGCTLMRYTVSNEKSVRTPATAT